MVGGEIAQDVDGELGDGMKPRSLNDLLEAFVKGSRDLEGDVTVRSGFALHNTLITLSAKAPDAQRDGQGDRFAADIRPEELGI